MNNTYYIYAILKTYTITLSYQFPVTHVNKIGSNVFKSLSFFHSSILAWHERDQTKLLLETNLLSLELGCKLLGRPEIRIVPVPETPNPLCVLLCLFFLLLS